jgi:hypothetical protein
MAPIRPIDQDEIQGVGGGQVSRVVDAQELTFGCLDDARYPATD